MKMNASPASSSSAVSSPNDFTGGLIEHISDNLHMDDAYSAEMAKALVIMETLKGTATFAVATKI